MTMMPKNIAIIGGSGAIGSAFTTRLSDAYPDATINVFSRHMPENTLANVSYHTINYQDESSIADCALLAAAMPLDLVIIATGILHDGELMPEKSLRELSIKKFQRLFEINTITPALLSKHFLPRLSKENRSVFAALSARVGSISDNQLGGWYAYRASKAALNMIIKNAAIEIGRCNKQAIIVSLHPGTVDSNLSKPFQRNVANDKLFTPTYAARRLLEVLDSLSPEQSGKCFAWDGQEVKP